MEEKTQSSNSLAIPGAIIVAGLFIAGAIFMTNGNAPDGGSNTVAGDTNTATEPAVPKLEKGDHIVGNPDAKIVIVEYSDTECPFCKNFHSTMNQVMETYGKDGQVAWVYRHFPLSIHPKAQKEAEATECAAELGGNEGFWEYINALFETTPSNNGLDLAVLPDIAEQVGLDRVAFQTCLDSGKYAEEVQKDFNNGVAVGVGGTPHSIGIMEDGGGFIIPGAQQYTIVDTAIKIGLKSGNSGLVNKYTDLISRRASAQEINAFISENFPDGL